MKRRFMADASAPALPVTIAPCEERFGVSKAVSGFVLRLGATMNMDGTALFEGIAAVFLAHTFRTAVNVESDMIGAMVTQRRLDRLEATGT